MIAQRGTQDAWTTNHERTYNISIRTHWGCQKRCEDYTRESPYSYSRRYRQTRCESW
jgi:hypothetical protein